MNGLHEQWRRAVSFWKPVETSQTPALEEHIVHGIVALTWVEVIATTASILAFLGRGGTWTTLAWVLLVVLPLQVLMVWRCHKAAQRGEESAGWLGSLALYIAMTVVLNGLIGLERLAITGLLVGMPFCVAVTVSYKPLRILVGGLGISCCLSCVMWHAQGQVASTAILFLVGAVASGLAAFSSQTRRHFWQRFHLQQRAAQAIERLETLGASTHTLASSLGSSTQEGLAAFAEVESLRRQLLVAKPHSSQMQSLSQRLSSTLVEVAQHAEEIGAVLQRVQAQTTIQGHGSAVVFCPLHTLDQVVEEARYAGCLCSVEVVPGLREPKVRGDQRVLRMLLEKILTQCCAMDPSQTLSVHVSFADSQWEVRWTSAWMDRWSSGAQAWAHAENGEDWTLCRDLARGFLGGELSVEEHRGKFSLFLVVPLSDTSEDIATKTRRLAWSPVQIKGLG